MTSDTDSVRQRRTAAQTDGEKKVEETPPNTQQLPSDVKTEVEHRSLILPSVSFWLLTIALACLVLIYLVIPISLHFSTTLQRNLIFLTFVRWPLFIDLKSPEKHGLSNTCNFYLESEEGISLGVWHMLPGSAEINQNKLTKQTCEDSLSSNNPVILYVHGNSGTRGGSHRVELYKVLRNLDYHVIAFDYRGYADSSNVSPHEDGVTTDATFMYEWVKKRIKSAPIIVWGHSLGTGVATNMVKRLCNESRAPAALILESPFNNLRDEIRHHPFAVFYRHMPYFDEIILDAVEKNIVFPSDKNIADVNIPILILHAEDDQVVPLHLGEHLYTKALKSRKEDSPQISFHKFGAEHCYGHRYICRAPELPEIVKNFVHSLKSPSADPATPENTS